MDLIYLVQNVTLWVV